MKRVIWLVCLFMLAFGVVGCGDDEQKAESNKEAMSEKELAEEKEMFILTLERNKYQLQENALELSEIFTSIAFRTAFQDGEATYLDEVEVLQQKFDQGLNEVQNMHVPDDQIAQEAYQVYLEIITNAHTELSKMTRVLLESDFMALFEMDGNANVIKWERFDEVWVYYKEKD